MRNGRHAKRGQRQLVGIGLGGCDQRRDVFDRVVAMGDQHHGQGAGLADRLKVLRAVVWHVLLHRILQGEGRIGAGEQGVSIGRRVDDLLGCDRRAAPGAIEHDHGLAHARLEFARNDAPDHVGGAARREGHDQLQRLFGVATLRRCDRSTAHHTGRRYRGRQKHPYHVETSLLSSVFPGNSRRGFRRQPSRIDGAGSPESTSRSTLLFGRYQPSSTILPRDLPLSKSACARLRLAALMVPKVWSSVVRSTPLSSRSATSLSR